MPLHNTDGATDINWSTHGSDFPKWTPSVEARVQVLRALARFVQLYCLSPDDAQAITTDNVLLLSLVNLFRQEMYTPRCINEPQLPLKTRLDQLMLDTMRAHLKGHFLEIVMSPPPTPRSMMLLPSQPPMTTNQWTLERARTHQSQLLPILSPSTTSPTPVLLVPTLDRIGIPQSLNPIVEAPIGDITHRMLLQPRQHPLYGMIFMPSCYRHQIAPPSSQHQSSSMPSQQDTAIPPTPYDEDMTSEWSQLMNRLAHETPMDEAPPLW